MTCRQLTTFIADYLSDELEPAVRGAFVHHLSICPNCVKYVTDYQRTIALGKLAFDDDDDVPADVPEELVAAILAASRSSDG